MIRHLMIAGVASLAVGCGAPRYTVLSAAPTSSGSTAPAASTWPDVGAAEQAGPRTDDVAVIVAIEDYAFLPDVPGAVANANAWENYLRKVRGFKEVFVVTDKQAPVEEIRRFAARATETASADGQLWFVFIGHGAPLKDGSDGAIVGMDAQQTIESIGARSLPTGELVKALEAGPQAQTVVVLDTCFSGRDSGGELLAEGTQPVIPVGTTPAVTKETVVLAAAGNDEVAGQLPGAERPAFSYLLLGAMRGWADDGDGVVTADEAIAWTRQQLRYVKGRQQTPSAAGVSQVVLTSTTLEGDPGIAALMQGVAPAAAPEEPAHAVVEGGTVIDTNKGLVFVKPQEWGIGPAGLGVVLTLQHQYTGSMIQVGRQKVNQANAAGFLGVPDDYSFQDLDIVRGPERIEHGPYEGQETEFDGARFEGDAPQRHIKFGTYQNGAAWVFILTLADATNRDADYEAFRTFLEQVKFQ